MFTEAHTTTAGILSQTRREGEFSRALRRLEGGQPSLKNTENGVPDGFFLT